MCVRVHTSTRVTTPWDSTTGTLTVPAGLSSARATLAVRAVLLELAVPQPEVGAVCWCGQVVEIPRVPQQRSREVIPRGA